MYGGIHATLFPDEPHTVGAAHAVVTGDGDVIWPAVLADCAKHAPERMYAAGRVPGDQMVQARWDLIQRGKYMWASVQTVRGCPKHCSFCSVWRTDGQAPAAARQRGRGRRSGAAAPPRLPVHRAGRRQLLPRHARRPRPGGAAAGPHEVPRAGGHAPRPPRPDAAAGRAAGRHGVLHADHDGGVRGSRIPRCHARGPHQGRARRRRVDHARRPEGGVQGVQRHRGRPRGAPPHLQGARHPRARVLHLRSSERSARDVSPRPPRSRARPTSPSRSSSCSRRFRARWTSTSGPRASTARGRTSTASRTAATGSSRGIAGRTSTRITRSCRPTRSGCTRSAPGISSTACRRCGGVRVA